MTTLKQKILLAVFGVLTAFALLEAGLRIAGAVYLMNQDRRNTMAMDDSEFRILCIGESTTALGGEDSYPHQLQEILAHARPDKKIKVINRGEVGKTSDYIYTQLKSSLDRYKPDLVIMMVGINDGLDLVKINSLSSELRRGFESLRVHKLVRFIAAHWMQKMADMRHETVPDGRNLWWGDEAVDSLADGNEQIEDVQEVIQNVEMLREKERQVREYFQKEAQGVIPFEDEQKLMVLKTIRTSLLVRLGGYYRIRKDYSEAAQWLVMAITDHPQSFGAYVELGRCYREQKQPAKAIALFKRAIELKPAIALLYFEMGRCFAELNQDEAAAKFYRRAIAMESKNIWIYPDMGRWLMDRRYYADAEQAFSKALAASPEDYFFQEQLAEVYQRQGNTAKARELSSSAQAGARRMNQYLPSRTRGFYNRMVDMILSRGISLVCMQYPLRDIQSLKAALLRRDDIVFVENKSNFMDALSGGQYTQYFTDHFAGDFGHCTREGNRLIAENAVKVILEKFLREQASPWISDNH